MATLTVEPYAGRPEQGVQYQDARRMYLPDSALKVRWYQVPYRYLTSSNSFRFELLFTAPDAATSPQLNP